MGVHITYPNEPLTCIICNFSSITFIITFSSVAFMPYHGHRFLWQWQEKTMSCSCIVLNGPVGLFLRIKNVLCIYQLIIWEFLNTNKIYLTISITWIDGSILIYMIFSFNWIGNFRSVQVLFVCISSNVLINVGS